jgi:proteasome lid subunit RPN8/RPN11
MNVVIAEPIWDSFVARSKRHHPLEHIEAIWGTETVDGFRILELHRLRITTRTQNCLDYDDIELARQKWLAEKEGLQFLGTVHSHPHRDNDSAPSFIDHIKALKDGERIMGILHLWKEGARFKSTIDWWFPQKPLDFNILPE